MTTKEDKLDFIRAKLRHGLTLTMSELIYLIDNGEEDDEKDSRRYPEEIETVSKCRRNRLGCYKRNCTCD